MESDTAQEQKDDKFIQERILFLILGFAGIYFECFSSPFHSLVNDALNKKGK